MSSGMILVVELSPSGGKAGSGNRTPNELVPWVLGNTDDGTPIRCDCFFHTQLLNLRLFLFRAKPADTGRLYLTAPPLTLGSRYLGTVFNTERRA